MSTIEARWVAAGVGLPALVDVVALRNISSKVCGLFVYKGVSGVVVDVMDGHPVVVWETMALGGDNNFLQHRPLPRASDVDWSALDVPLYRPQTAFGLALKLDAWEAARDPDWPGDPSNNAIWAEPEQWAEPWASDTLRYMATRLETIGLDHHIRRLLGGDNPQAGTLATFGFMEPHEQWWRYDARLLGGAFIEWGRNGQFIGSAGIPGGAPNVPALANITDPLEALRAIAEALEQS